MITAFVLITVDVSQIPEVAQALTEIEGVREVYSTTGDWDLIAIVRVPEHHMLAEVIADRMSKTPGIKHTQTHIAFRAYSSMDLEAAFAIGLD